MHPLPFRAAPASLSLDICVARFNESLSWAQTIRPGTRIVVYEKGEGKGIKLPNVGREAHTYLHHILSEYATLPDWTFFTQGDPNKHLPYTKIQTAVNGFPETRHRSAFLHEAGPIFFVDEPVRYLESDPQNEDIHNDVPGLWRELFTNEPPEEILFAPAAIFAIHKSRLHSRTPAFYMKAMELSVSQRPRGPWEFERLWAYLLAIKGHPPILTMDILSRYKVVIENTDRPVVMEIGAAEGEDTVKYIAALQALGVPSATSPSNPTSATCGT